MKCRFLFHRESTHNEQEEESYKKFIRKGKIYHPEDARKYKQIVRRLKSLPSSGKKLCEVGPRDGHFLTICMESGFSVKAVEPSPAMANLLAEKGIPVVNDHYEKSQYKQEEFDFIVMLQVLEHIPLPVENALAIAWFHLKKGGHIIIEVPSVSQPLYLLDRLKHSERRFSQLFIQDHCNYFSPQTITLATSRAGFRKTSLITGRWQEKYTGLKRLAGFIFDPILNLLRIGGILYIGQKID
ncbi:MAG: class I SAM-dependent methyltransferase [Bacteroidales bacterium]|nr:class I SAM-dependent methyltransferase [Bacteroidales bacterium]